MGRTSRREAEQRVLAALPGWVDTLSQLNRLIADRMGVTVSDLSCLHVLNQEGAATAAELAGKVGLTPGSVSRMIDRLDAAGLIKRTPKDRRRVLIEPTSDGLARIAAYYAGLTARTGDDLAVFSLDELNALLRFIERAHRSAVGELTRLRQKHEAG
jgi:DNA-binding MarR family transcriptional regulator